MVPGATALGVPVPKLRALAAHLRRTHRALSLEGVADLVDALAASGVREELLVGVFWLTRYGKGLSALPWKRVARWLPALDNWETCDQLAMGVAAPVVAADVALVRELKRLTRAASEWQRRFALATACAMNQKGRAHVAETLSVCAPLLADPSPNVRKAVGWALREATKHDPEAVFAFLRSHRGPVHPSVLREGTAKLPARRRAVLLRR